MVDLVDRLENCRGKNETHTRNEHRAWLLESRDLCARAIKTFRQQEVIIGSHVDEEEEEGREFWTVSVVGLLALLISSSAGKVQRKRENMDREY